MTRRLFLSSLLSGIIAAALGDIAPGEAAQAGDGQAMPERMAAALDRVVVEFSQRPQLHYNRQRQHRSQSSRRQRPPRRRRHEAPMPQKRQTSGT